MNVNSQNSRWHRIIPVLPLVLIGIYIFQYPILPLQDFPDWQFQGWVWNQFVFFNNNFGGYYILNPYVPPNSTLTILIGLLNFAFAPALAGKIAVLISCFTLYNGIYLFTRMHLRRSQISDTLTIVAASAIALLFVYNFNLFFGQIHFLLGMGITLNAAFLFHEKRWGVKILPMMAILILSYCTHFMAFAQLVLYIFLVIIIEKRKEYIRPMIIAIVPATILFIHYFMTSNVTSVEATMGLWMTLKEKVMVFPRIIAPFARFKSIISGSESGIKILNFAITAGWMGAILWTVFTHWKRKQLSVLDWILIITFLIAIILPPISLGMFAPGERFVMFGAIAGMILFLTEFPRIQTRVATALVILAIANYGWSQYQTSKFEQMITTGNKISKSDKSGLIDPSLRLIYYKTLHEKKTIPIFTTGLFSFSESIKPDIFFYTGQMKISESDTSSTNRILYDPYR